MKVLAIDVGGTNIKFLATGQTEPVRFPSGPTMTPQQMVAGVKKAAAKWDYDVVSIGLPGPVTHGRLLLEPHNLGKGWVGFDFTAAFNCPVKIVNDAAMQALGSYNRGSMVFFGLGTGLGFAFVVDGVVESRELAHLPFKKGTHEDYVGLRALKRHGKKKWRKNVEEIVARVRAAAQPDDVVLGGGNVKHLDKLPEGCRAGQNFNAFLGGFRLWENSSDGVGSANTRLVLKLPAKKKGAQK